MRRRQQTYKCKAKKGEGIMKKSILALALVLVMGLTLFPVEGEAQTDCDMGPGMMGRGMMGPGKGYGMMGRGMMGPGMMGMGMQRMGLMGMLHQWGSLLFAQKDGLGLPQTQIDQIESILNSHIKYAIRKNADRKILLIEIQELLIKDKVNLSEVEGKLKAMEALNTDIKMEGIRTLEQALAVLTPEQQKTIKTLFKKSTFVRAMMMGQGDMMGGGRMRGMMGQGDMMGGGRMRGMKGQGDMMGGGRMKGMKGQGARRSPE
jgi:Spy/CpxP family protein refolding chaperone